MAVTAGDIKFYLSGGAANTDVNASLGGAISSTEVVTATLHNLFDSVSSGESDAGSVEYRCLYIKNTHGTDTLEGTVVYISTNTVSADTTVEIALGSAAVGGTEQSIASETTAPVNVTFSSPGVIGTGLVIGNMDAGEHKSLWIKRIINAGAGVVSEDTAVISVTGDTVP